jgi:aldose sugar dehydrogenase
LINFDGKGKYSAPEFTWYDTVGPTALKFLDSDKLGNDYINDMVVGDINNGFLYHFDLNENRTELSLNGTLQDKIANDKGELFDTILAQGFDGGITDIEVSPYDGYLYVVTDTGSIFRILHI